MAEGSSSLAEVAESSQAAVTSLTAMVRDKEQQLSNTQMYIEYIILNVCCVFCVSCCVVCFCFVCGSFCHDHQGCFVCDKTSLQTSFFGFS